MYPEWRINGGYDKREVWVYQWHVRLIKWVQENHMNLRVFLHLFSRHSIAGLKCRVSIMCIGDPICFVQVWGVNHHARESATPKQVPHDVWVLVFICLKIAHTFSQCVVYFYIRMFTLRYKFLDEWTHMVPVMIRGEDSSLPLQELLDSRFKLLLALLNMCIVIFCFWVIKGDLSFWRINL